MGRIREGERNGNERKLGIEAGEIEGINGWMGGGELMEMANNGGEGA